MNIAVLGTGFGWYHVQLLKKFEQVKRIVVFGRNEDKLRKLKAELGVEITTCFDDILLDPEIDVIDSCLPSHLHSQYAIQALQHGKHVFCETPVALHLEDVLAMKRAEEQYGKRILVNQFIKFDWAYRYLYEAIQHQKYGKLISLTLKRETSPMWGDLGLNTITTKLMIHELDFVTWLGVSTDDCIVWGNQLENREQSFVRAWFQQSEPTIEVIVSSQMPHSYPFTVGYEAYFERAKLVFHESDSNGETESTLFENTDQGKHELALEKVNPYEKSLEHALQCLNEGADSIISLDHAIQSLDIAIKLKNRLVVLK
ncbi:Gfo/Idh/MocA family protein [Brevibacillus sp. SYSU BS000544]|uniref:Gfo/Idh/MocA family protein n=1 Tax=Brevibacillus sp. SYSU BS000544 TaxID=3416443 RepID=UPI003CE5B188